MRSINIKGALLYLFLSSFGFAQSFTSLVVYVGDAINNEPLNGATIIIKESGWSNKNTGSDGKAFFDSSIPIGEIRYIVSKEGYLGAEGTFNVTTELKSNTLIIKLNKIRADMLLITGEVLDQNGADLENVIVEAKIANYIKKSTTDKSGNYSIELSLSEIKYDAVRIKMEVKIGNECKVTEVLELPRRNILYKDFKLDCNKSQVIDPDTSENITAYKPIEKVVKDGCILRILDVYQTADMLYVEFKFFNNLPKANNRIGLFVGNGNIYGGTTMINYEGDLFYSKSAEMGGQACYATEPNKTCLQYADLATKSWVKGKVGFEGLPKINTISVMNIAFYSPWGGTITSDIRNLVVRAQ